jgi:hypothetical protein
LQSGKTICDYAVINRQLSEYTAVATMPTTLMVYDKGEALNLDSEALDKFKLFLHPLSSDDILLQKYLFTKDWKKYKTRLIASV